MESSLAKEAKVGIFVIIGLIAFCASVLLLGGDQMFFKSRYTLRVNLPQVQGLAPGSVVSLSGVPIGNVSEIHFVPSSKDIEVVMDVDKEVQGRITLGSTASIKTQGALGDKYVYIQPGPADAAPLKHNDFVAAEQGGDFIDVIAEKGPDLMQIVDVIKELKSLLQQLNGGGKGGQLMGNLVQGSANFNQLMIEGRQSAKRFDSILRKVDEGNGTLGSLINDPSLHNRLSNMLGESPRNKFLKPLIRDTIQSSEKKRGPSSN